MIISVSESWPGLPGEDSGLVGEEPVGDASGLLGLIRGAVSSVLWVSALDNLTFCPLGVMDTFGLAAGAWTRKEKHKKWES